MLICGGKFSPKTKLPTANWISSVYVRFFKFIKSLNLKKFIIKKIITHGDCLFIYGLRHTGSFHLAFFEPGNLDEIAVHGQTVGLL
jgi:hypothetical protein